MTGISILSRSAFMKALSLVGDVVGPQGLPAVAGNGAVVANRWYRGSFPATSAKSSSSSDVWYLRKKLGEDASMLCRVTVMFVCLVLFEASAEAQSAVLTCTSTAADVWQVYKAGAEDGVGSIDGNAFERWLSQRVPKWDGDALSIAWGATGDYARVLPTEAEDRAGETWRSVDGISNREVLQAALVTQCTRLGADPCARLNPGPAECLSFYATRYAPLLERMTEHSRSLLASPLFGQVQSATERASKDFGVKSDQLVLVGEYVTPEYKVQKLSFEAYALEQANLRAVARVAAAGNPGPSLTRGEFETTEAFKARVANLRATVPSAGNVGGIAFTRALELELNPFHPPYIDRQSKESIKYDADAARFDVSVHLSWTGVSVPMRVEVPVTDAPQTKVAMLADGSRYSDPGKYAEPWLVFELVGNRLTLKGGYLMRRAAIDKQLYVMRPVGQPLSMAVGKEAADKFRPKLAEELQARTAKEKLAEEAQRQQWCAHMKMIVATRQPEYYSGIVSRMGCQ